VEDAFELVLSKLPGSCGSEEPAPDIASAQETLPVAANADQSKGIDKSALAIAAPRRYRNKEHLRFVATQACLVCARKPSDPHHLRFMQPRALGRKVSDEFTVPLCRSHHRAVHRSGNEPTWWKEAGIDPVKVARKLWRSTRLNLKERPCKDAGLAAGRPGFDRLP